MKEISMRVSYQATKKMRNKGICENCKNEKIIFYRGMCQRCYKSVVAKEKAIPKNYISIYKGTNENVIKVCKLWCKGNTTKKEISNKTYLHYEYVKKIIRTYCREV